MNTTSSHSTRTQPSRKLARRFVLALLAAGVLSSGGCRGLRPGAAPEPLAAAGAAPAASSAAVRRSVGDSPVELTITKPQKYPVMRAAAYDPPSLAPRLPPNAFAKIPHDAEQYCPPGMPALNEPWAPDGLSRPWPLDEYIWDGGDREALVEVGSDWTVRGLDAEDTVAHYDTVDGRVQVTPSNRVPIYAPRFSAVRQVHGPEIHQTRETVSAADKPLRLGSQDTRQLASTALQPEQLVKEHNLRSPVLMREQTRGIPVVTSLLPSGFESRFLPYEDLSLIQRGVNVASEKARLSERTRAAVTWSSDQMAQAILEGVTAHLAQDSFKLGETYQYEMPPGKPRLRLVKIASKSEAQPGEIVEFTLRFDNVGEQNIGNVTIVDSLTPRLEYVEGSTQCSVKGKFGSQENAGESLVLRWEIDEPLKPGEGGVIRFQCKVR